MAAHFIKYLFRSGSFSQNKLGLKLLRRNSSTSGSASQAPPHSPSSGGQSAATRVVYESSSNSGLKYAVGIAIGLSLININDMILKRFWHEEEKPIVVEKPASTVDPKFIEHLISHDRQVNRLESELRQLKEDLRERSQQEAQISLTQSNQSKQGGQNVFELSEIIQANNLANSAKYDIQLEEQRKNLVREYMIKVEGEILKVENKYRPVINKINELEAHLEEQRRMQQREAPARLLWLSCQSLIDKLRNSPQEPLENDPAYKTLKEFAADNNQLAISVLDSIPLKALKEGVQSQEMLKDRFDKIEKLCKRVASVDAHGGGLREYVLSYLQSLVVIDQPEVPEAEVHGKQLVDPTTWTTYDILERVQYCLRHNNLEQAIRYANQLRGQARVVARDWIRDARDHLAARQAFVTLTTHAEAMCTSISENY